jgi:uncharacterized YigZ family protein
MEVYKTIVREGMAEFKDRGSRFLAYAFPIKRTEDFKERLQALKKEHPKAVHHCFAYRLGADGSQFRASDDGEPAGSAGKPILGQLHSREVTDAAIVVVRYFGGTLLGVPGLINAYKTSAALALQVTPIEEKAVEATLKINCTYHDVNEVMRIVKMCSGTLLTNNQGLFCELTVSLPKNRIPQAEMQLGGLYQVSFETVA